MKKTRKQEKANSLETLLVHIGRSFKENKEKITQMILLILIAVAAVLFLRFYFYGKPQKFQGEFDQAYYYSTQQSMMTSVPNAAPYDELAAHFTKGNEGAEARISAGEALLKTGQMEVEQKKEAGKAKTAAAEVIAMNPEKTFSDAIKRFEEVTGTQMAADPLLAARALYGCGAAYESLAAVTAGDDQVALKLDSAKACYQKILDQFGETAFAAQAKDRVDALTAPITVAYYKKTADQFVTMPEPELAKPLESILSENADSLDPASGAGLENREDFSLKEENSSEENPAVETDEKAADEKGDDEKAAESGGNGSEEEKSE